MHITEYYSLIAKTSLPVPLYVLRRLNAPTVDYCCCLVSIPVSMRAVLCGFTAGSMYVSCKARRLSCL